MTKILPFVGIVPYELRKTKNLPGIPIDTLLTIRTEKPAGVIKDLTEFDHIVIYPRSKMWLTNYKKLNCKVSLMIAEPKALHHTYYNKIWFLRFKFHTIFVCQKTLADKYRHVIAMPLSGCWISSPDELDYIKKDKLISLIASSKNILAGHKLRHEIVNQIDCDEIDILGHGYAPFKDKQDGLLPYQFSIVIENCQETDYFTEKIVDSLVCKTIPIYWGAPNIGDYFNLEGIIIFQTIKELQLILDGLTRDSYQKFQLAVEENYTIARKLSNTTQMITDKLIGTETNNKLCV